jgi:hypothetical protein
MVAHPQPKEADMPNGIYPIPPFNSHPTPAIHRRSSLGLRFRTRSSRKRLDGQLARGTDPATTDELTLRAEELRSREVRAHLARRLIEALGDARRPNLGPFTARGRRQRFAVEESRDDLLALILRLQDDAPVDVRGAAMTAQLVSAGVGRHPEDAEELRHAVRAARFALDTAAPSDQSMPTAA